MHSSSKKGIYIKRCVMIMAFICICITINSFMNFMFIPYSYVEADYNNVYNNKYDTIFVGTSHGKCGINPKIVDSINGGKSVNLCLGGEYLSYTYYKVKDVCRKFTPKKVVYELDPSYWTTEEYIGTDSSLLFYNMEWSSVKLQMYVDKLMGEDFRLSLFPWYIFKKEYKMICGNVSHKSYIGTSSSICNSDFKNKSQKYEDNGFIYRKPVDFVPSWKEYIKWDESKVNTENLKYFRKLVKLCNDKDIELIVIITPVPNKTLEKYKNSYDDMNKYFAKLTEKYDVKFYDFTKIKNSDMDIKSFCDEEGHLNGESANEFSKELAKYIK